jgi:hypothetical protein
MIQSSETSELTAEADDAQSARDLIEAQVPDGFELVQVHNTMPRGGRVVAKGLMRAAAVSELEAEAPDYATAKRMIESELPAGFRVLSFLRVG